MTTVNPIRLPATGLKIPKPDPLVAWDQWIAETVNTLITTERPSESEMRKSPLPRSYQAKPPDFIRIPTVPRNPAKINPALKDSLREIIGGNLPWPLYLWGPAGTGKTCAALCLYDYGGGHYYPMPVLLDLLVRTMKERVYYGEGKLFTDELWELIENTRLVTVDDIGTRTSISDHHYDALKILLDRRDYKPLVLTGNLDPAALATLYDERIASRITAGTVINLAGVDRRIAG